MVVEWDLEWDLPNLVMEKQFANLNMAIEIVDLAMKHGHFQ